MENPNYNLTHNPADLVDKAPKQEFKNEIYTEHDMKTLIEVFLHDRIFILVLLGVYYGLRRSEVLGLEWNAVDFNMNTITIKQVAYYNKGSNGKRERTIKSELKSKSSYRTLPLYPIVRTVLLDELEKQNDKRQKYKNQYEKNSFVCVDDVGKWLKLENVTTHFPCVLKMNGLKVIRYHDLRHLCATILYNKNIQQRDLKDCFGCSSSADAAPST